MKSALVVTAVLVLVVSGAAVAGIGDTYLLPIHHRDGGGWTEFPGAGYGGTSAWQGSGMDGVRRAYWELSGAPAAVRLYSIEFWTPTQGAGDWQPIESQLNGVNGEQWPIEPGIPWVGAWGTNHQYIGSDFGPTGVWKSTGPGPHTPESSDYNAGANGTYMWLKNGSWLYAKWDFPWDITRCWSYLKLTEVPEPSGLIALVAGLPALALIRRRK